MHAVAAAKVRNGYRTTRASACVAGFYLAFSAGRPYLDARGEILGETGRFSPEIWAETLSGLDPAAISLRIMQRSSGPRRVSDAGLAAPNPGFPLTSTPQARGNVGLGLFFAPTQPMRRERRA
ncbi:MAG: hypothetical protein ACF8QF_06900, partial [Phycisphaerales bacterium]